MHFGLRICTQANGEIQIARTSIQQEIGSPERILPANSHPILACAGKSDGEITELTRFANTSGDYLSSAYIHLATPSKTTRIVSLSTGIWSGCSGMHIHYKTNGNKVYCLSSHGALNPEKSYNFKLDAKNWEARGDSHITDIWLSFDKITPDASIVQPPAYTQQYQMISPSGGIGASLRQTLEKFSHKCL